MLLRWLEIILAAVLVILLVTQVVVPLWTGRRLFPLFRSRPSEKRLIAAHERVEEVALIRAADEIDRSLNATVVPAAPVVASAAVEASGASAKTRKRSK